MNRIVKVDEFHYGECELDVERVIALVPKKRMLLFERAYWELKQEDYDRVSEVWHKLKSKELWVTKLKSSKKENSMTDKEKLVKIKKLADAMYHEAQNLTSDASRLHKAMNEYNQFIIQHYND